MRLIYKKYTLNGSAVDAISAGVQDYLKKLNAETSRIQRIRLTVEELLLNIMEHCGEGQEISVGLGKQFGRHIFRLCYVAEPFDPSNASENPAADDIMRLLGSSPAWSHRGKNNTVSLVLANRPKRSTVFRIITAMLAAVLLGFAGGAYINETVRQSLIDSLLTPMANGFLGLLTTFSGLMIALTVCSGMLGMGDSASFGRIGKSLMTRLVVYSFAVSFLTLPLTLPFVKLNLSSASDGGSSPLSQISSLFFDILPSNIITPFQTGNALQIIVIAVILGIALISVGERGSRVRDLINESAAVMQRLVSSVCSLVPVYVFVILLRQIWVGQEKSLVRFLKTAIISIVLTLILAAAIWLLSALKLRCSPITLMKKILPPFLVALTSASSMSALPLAMDVCENKLGVRQSTVSFAMPLEVVIYMPSSIVHFTVVACTFAEIYNVDLSLSFLLMIIVIVPLCAIALPPIPGAGPIIFTILFGSLGIPSEAIVMAVAMDLVFDFFDTGFNVLLLMLRTACEAKIHNALDQKILLSK